MTYVRSDVLEDLAPLDTRRVSISPAVSALKAEELAKAEVAVGAAPGALLQASSAKLMIYAPGVQENRGPTRAVWQVNVTSPQSAALSYFVLVDAATGRTALSFSLIHEAKNREIHDSNNTSADPGTLVRTEGSLPSGIPDVDNAYDFYGDTYDFYFSNHGRDSIDNAGYTLSATVRYCDPFEPCPYANAFWNGSRMYFGQGFSAADDVVAHELTHGVTQYESGLIYFSQSGAINEAFSDIWGEFVDLSNTGGTDTPAVRWLLGEDVPGFGAIRNMQDPTAFGHPDRVQSPLFYTGPFDNGGVHINSGVINKLCYLLTDGGAFNSRTVTAMGIPLVADLFYEAQTNLLTPSSNFMDLYDALTQAAINLALTTEQQTNVDEGCLAVELNLLPPGSEPPDNDDCAEAICIPDETPITGASFGATGSDITSCASADTNDVWFTYTPASSGSVTIDTDGSAFDTTLAVFSACGGSELACDDDSGPGLTSSVTLSLTSGVTYYLRIGGFGGDTGNYTITVHGGGGDCPGPANDDCADAIAVTEGLPYLGTTDEATGADTTGCGGGSDFYDVWHSFTPASSGVFQIDTIGSALDTTLAIYDACGGAELACDDQSGGGNASLIAIALTGSTTYYIRVAGWTGQRGDYTLLVSEINPPANDDCANAIAVAADIPYFGSTLASSGTSTTSCGGGFDTFDVWHTFTPAASGMVRIDTNGSSLDTTLGVYDACAGTEIACDDQSGGGDASLIDLSLSAGVTYFIRVAGWSAQRGSYVLTISEGSAPPADECAQAGCLADGTPVFGSTVQATGTSASSCGFFDNKDVWYKYEPLSTGSVTISTLGSSFDTTLAVYDACGGAELACSDDFIGLSSSVTLTMNAGSVYLVRIAGFGGDSGFYAVEVTGGGGGGCQALKTRDSDWTRYE